MREDGTEVQGASPVSMRSTRRVWARLLSLACTVFAWSAAAAAVPVPDRVVLDDGRILEGCRAERSEQALFLRFPHGRLRVEPTRIKEIVRDIDDTCAPSNDFERRQLAKGLVFFEGSWCSKKRRDAILEERRSKREARLEKLTARLEWENAWRRNTAHFEVKTNTSEELLDYYAGLVEDFFEGFCKRWGPAASRGMKGRRPVVEIYRSSQEYYASGVPVDSEGVFQPREMRIRLYHDAADPRFTLDVLFHETTHLMVHLMRPDFVFPKWLDEGLAEYFGAAMPEGGGRIAWGGVQEGRLAELRHALRDDRYLPMEKVMLVTGSRFGSLHYAESWCFVHFLMEHKKYRARFMAFMNGLVTGSGVEETLIPAARGRRHLRTVKPRVLVGFLDKKLGVSSISDLEREFLEYVYYGLPEVGARGHVALARIKIREGAFDEALDDLEAALEEGTRDPTCFIYRARIRAMRGRYAEAAADYMRALEQDPLQPAFHYELGVALRASEEPLMMEEGLRHLYLAVEIAPDDVQYTDALEKALTGEDLEILRRIKERLKQGAVPGLKGGSQERKRTK